MKNTKSRIIIGGIATFVVIGLLLSVFSLFVYQIKDTFKDLEDKLEESEIDLDVKGEDPDPETSPGTDSDSSSESDSSDGDLDTLTIENGGLGYTLFKSTYNDGNGERDVYLLGIGVKSPLKANTKYRIKWTIDENIGLKYNAGPLYGVFDGVVAPAIEHYWQIDGSAYHQKHACSGNVGHVLNLNYPYTHGEDNYEALCFSSLALFTDDYDTASSMAKGILTDGYFTNFSITEEVAE